MTFKRIIASAAALCIAASLFACNKDAAASSSAASSNKEPTYVSVEEYASKGEILGCKFALKSSIEDIKKAYRYGEEDSQPADNDAADSADDAHGAHDDSESDEDSLMIIEGDTAIRMISSDTKYYYRSWLVDSGVAFIAYFGDSYSYTVGSTTVDELRKSISATPETDGEAGSDSLFFIPGDPESMYMLRYKFGDYVVSFFFENDCLAATTIYCAPLWTDFETN